MGGNPFDIPFDTLSLEPLDAGPTAVADVPVREQRAKYTVDTRGGRERRVLPERRQEFRLTADRRSGKDRRPRRSWEPGNNL